MSISEAIAVFNKLLKTTNNKRERRIYESFLKILENLKNKDLSERESPLLLKELSSLHLETSSDNSKKYYKQKLTEFKAFLKVELDFTTEKHYTEIGMVYGLMVGTVLGILYGAVIDSNLGSSMGLPMGTSFGMLFGLLYGARKDAEAKKLGRVV
ncbi:hypothetical protein Q4534_19295 [Cyclobacterium sp. 1_MG-2023]|uniref:hypothetical protein n=1 Tax=Cyclobacterium sp. 1_MG-2023 TaxID=3062681 RepID=UPI0026E1838D|nr:hypothetical protein [Cyclobacterium sp. 1_MG-2023]MDO6439580.1 hypothetical protein [Cyclobacterium sp. 1_MG-2023]